VRERKQNRRAIVRSAPVWLRLLCRAGKNPGYRPPAVARGRLALILAGLLVSVASAAELDPLVDPANRIAPNEPAWKALAAEFAQKPDASARFSEQRFFPFRQKPVELRGESRVSSRHGLSLHYTEPEERTVILDTQGVLVRDARGDTAAPADPRANAATAALGRVLRFDLDALAADFELYGRREGRAWTLAFAPRAAELQQGVGLMVVAGEGASMHRIEFRRSPKQYVAILLGPARPTIFTADEIRRYFR